VRPMRTISAIWDSRENGRRLGAWSACDGFCVRCSEKEEVRDAILHSGTYCS
jgi:hypothetical protein